MKLNIRLFIFAFLLFVFLGGALYISSAQTDKEISPVNMENAYRANNIGVARLEQFDYKESVAAFRKALELDPKLKIAQINLAIALFNAQDVEGALEVANIAAKNSPDAPQPVYILGLIARNQNRIEDAIAFFQKVLAIDPNDVGANVNVRTNLHSTAKIRRSGEISAPRSRSRIV